MAHFAKPAEGSWTEHYPELGTGPVSYEDSISPEHYELERKAIFARTWLNVGRVEQLPRNGSYFTKELDAAGTSVVVVRGPDGTIRVLPQHLPAPGQQAGLERLSRARRRAAPAASSPASTTAGVTSLEGQLTFVQQESEFFDLDQDDYGLAAVAVDTWEGFIFVNLDPDNTTSLRRVPGGVRATGIVGYPFDQMTQVYKYRADVGANWKLFVDAFAEFYHAPILHAKQATAEESRKLSGYGFEALAYELDGPHGMVSSWGGMSPPKDLDMVKPIERVLAQRAVRPVGPSPISTAWTELPPAINPARHRAWGVDSFVFFPNFMLLVWQPGWYLTYHYWPTSYNTHIFEGTLYFVPPKNARERLQQELAAVTFKEYALQDGNTLEATQTMLESRAVSQFPLNDQEILLRHLHKTARGYVERLSEELRHAGPDLGRFLSTETTRNVNPADRIRRSRALRRLVARRARPTLRQTAVEHAGRTPGLLRCRLPPARGRHGLPRPVRLHRAPRRTPPACCGSATRWSTSRSRSRCGASPGSPTVVRPAWTCWSSRPS